MTNFVKGLIGVFILGIIVAFAFKLILGPDRARIYSEGSKKAVQEQVDNAVSVKVKLNGLKEDAKKARKEAIALKSEAAVYAGKEKRVKDQIQELESRANHLYQEIQNGKKLLSQKKKNYHIAGRDFSFEDLYNIVLRKAEAYKTVKDEIKSLEKQLASLNKAKKLLTSRADKLEKIATKELNELENLEKRYETEAKTAEVLKHLETIAKKSPLLDSSAHNEILDQVRKKILSLEAENQMALTESPETDIDLLSSDLSGNSTQSLLDEIDRKAGLHEKTANSTSN